MGHWAKAPFPREQLVLIATTLDDRISDDHVVRVFAEILAGYDWSSWKATYHGRLGQPPIHPRILAGLWLYALRRGVRSSRKVEYMAGQNIDFMWLAEGHTPDHTTLSEFRSKFRKELKHLFTYVARVAMAAGFLTLVDIGTDGTRIKANNSRFETWNAARIAKALEELAAEFEKRLTESQKADDQEMDGLGDASVDPLPPDLTDLAQRQKKLQVIQEQLREADEARRKDGIDPAKYPAQIPKHDPESRVLPNKEGGYAPNYTPLATTEGHGGYIVDADVIVGPAEHHDLVPSLDRITTTFGEKPEHALADGAFATGANITELEARGIAFFSPISKTPEKDNPAIRPDPTQPVPETDCSRLPVNPKSKTLDKACFVYDAPQDVYYCPRGEPMPYEQTKTDKKHGETAAWRVYRCVACAGCPLAAKCISGKNKTGGRSVNRDVYAPQRERHAAKMETPEAHAIYDRRMQIAETPFGYIKQVLGLRQFLLRGLEKVKTESLWTCTAANLDKLARDLRGLRARMDVATATALNN
ncbi:MAG: IS1182 family transposase [Planctomycetaceae bacterium]|nr:IS1182 family transposase [Planctomycetaceae bacterium]